VIKRRSNAQLQILARSQPAHSNGIGSRPLRVSDAVRYGGMSQDSTLGFLRLDFLSSSPSCQYSSSEPRAKSRRFEPVEPFDSRRCLRGGKRNRRFTRQDRQGQTLNIKESFSAWRPLRALRETLWLLFPFALRARACVLAQCRRLPLDSPDSPAEICATPHRRHACGRWRASHECC